MTAKAGEAAYKMKNVLDEQFRILDSISGFTEDSGKPGLCHKSGGVFDWDSLEQTTFLGTKGCYSYLHTAESSLEKALSI
jgi:hypothetical protein